MKQNSEYVQIHKVYENALNNLHSFTNFEQSLISTNIASLNFIDDILNRNDSTTVNKILQSIADEVNNRTAVPDIMSLSAMVYKAKEKGYYVKHLIDAMNSQGAWLVSESFKNKNKSL